MLVCYVDDSDDNLSSVATMAGYFATEDNWTKYEQTAAQVYRAYDVTCLHCRDFRLTKGEFTGWPLVKKNSFIEELFQAAHGVVSCGVSVCMSKSLHKSFRSFGRTGHISVHGMAFGALVGKFVDGQMLPVLLGQKEIGFKVESSNKDGEFLHTFKAFLRSGDAPTIKFVEFVKKEDCLAVHLADFWAMYSRRLSPLVKGLNAQTLPDIPTPLKAAFNYIPHALDNVTGMASVFARDRRKI